MHFNSHKLTASNNGRGTHTSIKKGLPVIIYIYLIGETPGDMRNNQDSLASRLLLIAGGVILGTVIAIILFGHVFPAFFQKKKIALTEVPALRDHLDNNPKSLFMYDEETSYRLKPSFEGKREYAEWSVHSTNSLGVLGSEINPNADVAKLIFLGDSVTYGSGVAFDQTFSSHIQRAAGPDIQVINAGTPGFSTNQELLFYKKYLSILRPKVVIQVFCPNDLVDYEWVWDGHGAFTMSEEINSLGGLIGESKTAEGLKILMKRLHFAGDSKLAPLAEMYNVFMKGWDPVSWEKYEHQIFKPPYTKETRWIVCYIPLYWQLASIELGGDKKEICFPQRKLAGLLKRKNIKFIDLTDALYSAKAPSRKMLYVDPIHLSPLGHEVVAAALKNELRMTGVLK